MDITDVRAQNVRRILDALRSAGSLTKKEIAGQTGLSFSTVSSTCNELLGRAVLKREKIPAGSVGRMPGRFSLLTDRFAVCCVDLQQVNRVQLAVTDLNSRCLYLGEAPAPSSPAPDAAATALRLRRAAELFGDFAATPQGRALRYICVCVAVAGLYDEQTGTLLFSPASRQPLPLRALAEDCFHLPCVADSGSNFCAMAIKQRRPQEDDFVYLHLAESINAGIFCQGALLRGHSGHAARIAHLPLGDPARKCEVPGCDLWGCIRGELCLSGMLRDLPVPEDGSEAERWARAAEAVAANPAAFGEYLREKAAWLGRLLAVTVDLFDPAVVYLGGKCTRIFAALQPFLSADLRARCPLAFETGLEIAHDADPDSTLREGMTRAAYHSWRPLADAAR